MEKGKRTTRMKANKLKLFIKKVAHIRVGIVGVVRRVRFMEKCKEGDLSL